MAAHTYWRMRVTGIQGGGFSYLKIAEMQFLGTDNLPISLAGGTPIGTAPFAGSALVNAFDGDPNSLYQSNNGIASLGSITLGMQFAAPVDVAAVVITCEADPTVSTPPTTCPTVFTIQYSDDNVTYTDSIAPAVPSWGRGESKLFGSFTEPSEPEATFNYTGAYEEVVVAAGATVARAKMWGGAGGPGRYSANGQPGGGGFTYVSFPVAPGDVLRVEVGGGGEGGKGSPLFRGGFGGWPDGGYGAFGDTQGGGGGGSTRLWKNGVLIAVAGAGGGGSGFQLGPAGGGGLKGVDAGNGGGTGGTQTAGGFDQDAPTSVPKQGGYLSGGKGTSVGNNTTSTTDDGGGGGGGYYGGGGGGGDGRSGGGGSGYVNPVGAGFTMRASQLAANRTDSDYVAGIGLGPNSATGDGPNGGNGLVKLFASTGAAPPTLPIFVAMMVTT